MTPDPVEYSSQPTSGLRFYEKGYIVLKRPQTESKQGFTLVQTLSSCIRSSSRAGMRTMRANCVSWPGSSWTAPRVFMSGHMIEDFLMDQQTMRVKLPRVPLVYHSALN